MSEGRAGIQRIILQYQQQRSDAMRVLKEADVVLPFLRAAIEELDAADDQPEGMPLEVSAPPAETADTSVRPEPQVAPAQARTAVSSEAGSPFSGEIRSGRSSIASLVQDADSKAS